MGKKSRQIKGLREEGIQYCIREKKKIKKMITSLVGDSKGSQAEISKCKGKTGTHEKKERNPFKCNT